jgi:hypothetical protein
MTLEFDGSVHRVRMAEGRAMGVIAAWTNADSASDPDHTTLDCTHNTLAVTGSPISHEHL